MKDDWENFSYIETAHEAAARYLERAIEQIEYAQMLNCMRGEPELMEELNRIKAGLRRQSLKYCPDPKDGMPRFRKIHAT